MVQLSTGFVSSTEFQTLFGQNASDADLLTRLYQNILHRDPEPAGFDYWLGQLQSSAQSRTQVLTGFSESAENQVQVIGVIQNGIEFTPYAG